MKYKYLITGPEINLLQEIQKHQEPGVEVITILKPDDLRGRTCGELVKVGKWWDRWNGVDWEESVFRFEDRCKNEPVIEPGKDQEFFDYGIE